VTIALSLTSRPQFAIEYVSDTQIKRGQHLGRKKGLTDAS